MRHSESFFNSIDGLQLYQQSWQPAQAQSTIVIVHGYAEHSSRYGHVANYLAAQGFAVHSFDLRGHGQSEGDRCFVNSFNDYLSDVNLFVEQVKVRESNQPWFILGHSLGGAIATLFVIRYHPPCAGLILSAPFLQDKNKIPLALITATAWLSRFLPKLPTLKLNSQLISRDPQVVAAYQTDPRVYHGRTLARTGTEIIKATQAIQAESPAITLPLLILHGTDDRIADVEGSKQLYAQVSASDKSLRLYDGLYHELFNEPEKMQVLDEMVQWARSRGR